MNQYGVTEPTLFLTAARKLVDVIKYMSSTTKTPRNIRN